MLQFILSRTALILLATTLAVLTVACNKKQQVTMTSGDEQATPTDKSVASPVATMAAPPASPQPEPAVQHLPEIEVGYFEQGLDKAVGAFSISQSAQSTEDWNLVAVQLADAIALMKKVPVDSPYFTSAQAKILDYQRHLKYAIQKATRPPNPPPQAQPERIVVAVPQTSVTPPIAKPSIIQTPTARAEKLQPPLPEPSPVVPPRQQEAFVLPTKRQNEQQVYTVPIKRRIGGTPIIEVTFNGTQPFEMILDTGASGTVITQKMANSLSVIQVGRAKANTANSKAVEFPIGYVNSIEVGGVKVNRTAVAIAGADLETGLLGHDFFGNYDITIKRDVVEFRPQSRSRSVSGGLSGRSAPSSFGRLRAGVSPIHSTQQEIEFTAPTVPKERSRITYP
ncbi:MAG: retroviral-like aspartic protease family protein [Iphinoe sp. HA4291-MV1]|jgi:predicted aspartyl protease|nr:retroviral-like aspartic protease family protein [Iphinoe sp. HA4291-MV1]